MTEPDRRKLERAYRNSFSVGELSRLYGFPRSEIQRVLCIRIGKSKQQKRREIRERAIAELRADGCDERVIAANEAALKTAREGNG